MKNEHDHDGASPKRFRLFPEADPLRAAREQIRESINLLESALSHIEHGRFGSPDYHANIRSCIDGLARLRGHG